MATASSTSATLGLKEPGPPAANPQRRGATAVQSHRAQGPDRFVALDVQGSGRDDVQDQERERWLSTRLLEAFRGARRLQEAREARTGRLRTKARATLRDGTRTFGCHESGAR